MMGINRPAACPWRRGKRIDGLSKLAYYTTARTTILIMLSDCLCYRLQLKHTQCTIDLISP